MVSQQSLLPERVLIDNARKGDQQAFTALMKKYEQLVYGFSFKVCRDKEKASETLQDTFVNVYRNLTQFSGKSKFSTWLYTIVTNNCLMKKRKRKIEHEMVYLDEPPLDGQSHDQQIIPSWRDTPIEKIMNGELKEQLDRAIRKLPLEYRIVFILRDIENVTANEAAKILRLSVPAVKSRLRRARVFLREQLNDYMIS
jgi:RNA polymerase sigma-70 factor, ECF subfamily